MPDRQRVSAAVDKLRLKVEQQWSTAYGKRIAVDFVGQPTHGGWFTSTSPFSNPVRIQVTGSPGHLGSLKLAHELGHLLLIEEGYPLVTPLLDSSIFRPSGHGLASHLSLRELVTWGSVYLTCTVLDPIVNRRVRREGIDMEPLIRGYANEWIRWLKHTVPPIEMRRRDSFTRLLFDSIVRFVTLNLEFADIAPDYWRNLERTVSFNFPECAEVGKQIVLNISKVCGDVSSLTPDQFHVAEAQLVRELCALDASFGRFHYFVTHHPRDGWWETVWTLDGPIYDGVIAEGMCEMWNIIAEKAKGEGR